MIPSTFLIFLTAFCEISLLKAQIIEENYNIHDIKCFTLAKSCTNNYISTKNSTHPCGDQEAVIMCFMEHLKDCINHSFYLQKRQDHLRCALQNSKTLSKLQQKVKSMFTKYADLSNPLANQYLLDLYQNSEGIVNFMAVLDTSITSMSFHRIHNLYDNLDYENRVIFCCHLFLITDELNSFRTNGLNNLTDIDFIIFNFFLGKDLAKVDFHKTFFSCDECLCCTKCLNDGILHHLNLWILFNIFLYFLF